MTKPDEVRPAGRTVLSRFRHQVDRHPHRIALSAGAEQLTYEQLDLRADRLARRISTSGVGPGARIATCVARSADLVVIILAVLKAGCTYVPIDPAYPSARIKFLLTDSESAAVITDSAELDTSVQPRQLVIRCDHAETPAETAGPLPVGTTDDSALLYIIYTSGSTGTPKGVGVSHANVLALMDAAAPLIDAGPSDVWSLFHSTSFDFSVWEIWGALLNGGRLVVLDTEQVRSPEGLLEVLRTERVTVLNQVPSVFRHLVSAYERLGRPELAVRVVVFGGEPLNLDSVDTFRRLWPGSPPRMINMYGITETTVHVSFCELTDELLNSPHSGTPIGRPLPHLGILLLDEQGEQVPPGTAGEMWIHGTGVTGGYLGRPELTASRFRQLPGVRGTCYRSGDLARLEPDGSLRFLGRLDEQVKIRGFRIEPGEIEAVLEGFPEISGAVVTAYDLARGGRRLVAHVESVSSAELDRKALDEFVRTRLPGHLVPTQYVVLPRLPITANGKVDRRGLPDPDEQVEEPTVPGATISVEQTLIEIWAEVLELDPSEISPDRGFFASGGDSLNSIEVHAAAAERGLSVSPEQLFLHQTVRELAAAVTSDLAPPAASDAAPLEAFALLSADDRRQVPPGVEDAYPMTMLQQGLLVEADLGMTSSLYHDIVVSRIDLVLDTSQLQQALDELVAAHPTLRSSFDIDRYDEPLCVVAADTTFALSFADLTGLPVGDQDAAIQRWSAAEQSSPIPWQSAPMARAIAFRTGPAAFSFGLSIHHAIIDGYSITVLLSRLVRRYADLLTRADAEPLTAESIRFSELVRREQQALNDPEAAAWWRSALAGYQPPATTPLTPSSEHRRRVFEIDSDICARLRATAQTEQVSLRQLLLTAHAWVVGQVYGTTDVLTGLVTHGRSGGKDALELAGLFLNTLPFRLMLGQPSWNALTHAVAQHDGQVQAHRMYPYAQIVRDVGRSGSQLLPATFNFVRYDKYAQLSADSLPLTIEAMYVQAEFPYQLYAEEEPETGAVWLDLRLAIERWTDGQTDRVADLYRWALAEIAACGPAAPPLPSDPRRRAAAALDRDLGTIVSTYELVAMQRDLYIHQARFPDDTTYCLGFQVALGADIDATLWAQAVALVTEADESLRVRLWERADGTAAACVIDRGGDSLQQVVLGSSSDLPDLEALLAVARRPYRLFEDELIRHYLAVDADGCYHAVLGAHHLALDGASGAIVVRRLLDTYQALTKEQPTAAVPSTFSTFVQSTDSVIDTPEAVGFWREQAKSVVPLSIPKPPLGSPGRIVEEAVLDADAASRLRLWCDRSGITLPNLLMAAYSTVLRRVFGGKDPFVVERIVAGRPAGHQDTTGCFYRVVPMVSEAEAGIERETLVHRIQTEQRARSAYRVSVLAQRSTFPAQSVRFVYNFYTFTAVTPSHRLRVVDDEPDDEAHLVVDADDGRLVLSFRYRGDHLPAVDLPKLVIRAAHELTCPGTVDSIGLLSAPDADALLRLGDGGPPADDGGTSLDELVFERAAQHLDAPAVISRDGVATYRELLGSADQLATRLRALGVRPEDRVAVALERSSELVHTLLAVLRAGGAFVPLDTSYPPDRLTYMLADSGATVLVGREAATPAIPPGISRCAPEVSSAEPIDPAGRSGVSSSGLAYMIYTSGSTGHPKGAMNEHGAIVNRLQWMQNALSITTNDRILQKTPHSFDVSVCEFFAPLISGAGIVVAESGRHGDPLYLIDLIDRTEVTMAHFVPSMLRLFLDAVETGQCTSLRCVIASGETLTPEVRSRFQEALPGARLYNLYGPTEAAVDVTWRECSDDGPVVPIGRPISGTSIYLLDERCRLLPAGAVGDLYIGGVQVGRGYGGRPDLTAASFVPDPFSAWPGRRMYRTGDRARWLPGGELEFLGRTDDQVKLRGFRIELGEIETALRELPEIRDAVVQIVPGPAGGRLVAYLAPASDGLDWHSIVERLRNRLPAHFVPAVHVVLAALPLSPNGKVDRAALRAIEPSRTAPVLRPASYLEEQLSQVWSEVLQVDAVGVEDNFFELGGDSLLLLRVLGKVRSTIDGGSGFSVADAFDHPTVRSLATFLAHGRIDEAGPRLPGIRSASPQRDRRLAARRHGPSS